MKQHRRYEIAWHAREIRVYVDGAYSHSVNFAAALDYQREIVRLLIASLHRNEFDMVAPASDGAWSYEGYSS